MGVRLVGAVEQRTKALPPESLPAVTPHPTLSLAVSIGLLSLLAARLQAAEAVRASGAR